MDGDEKNVVTWESLVLVIFFVAVVAFGIRGIYEIGYRDGWPAGYSEGRTYQSI